MDLLADILTLIVEQNVTRVYDFRRIPADLYRGLDIAHLPDRIFLLFEQSQSQLRLVVSFVIGWVSEKHLRLGTLPLILS